MITFFIKNVSRRDPETAYPQMILVPDGWNDWWKFTTLYWMVFIDSEGERHDIGGIKIGQYQMETSRPALPQTFTQLPSDFFSLGQDFSYYEAIKDLGDDLRDEIHSALNDIAFDEAIYTKCINETVTTNSLLRSVSVKSVEGQFRRLATGNSSLTPYDFEYTSYPNKRHISPIKINFIVTPKSNPPTNIHVIIGRNGVGKTRLLHNMSQCIMGEGPVKYGKFESSIGLKGSDIFANLISVTFSAFDETEPLPERQNKTMGISRSYIGLKDEGKKIDPNAKKIFSTKSPTKLKNEFARSAYLCKIGGKLRRYKAAIHALEVDPIFRDADLNSILEIAEREDFETGAAAIFHKLSSGHKIVLLTITRLVETLEERSLVLIDEPEAHLHPPLLSAFIRALSDLLTVRNAVAIIATHSPVVIQEVPRSCCWKLQRNGHYEVAERLEIESFGENVGSLTQEVFGLEVTDSGFHRLLVKSLENNTTYENVIEDFDGQLGMEAKAIIRVLTSDFEQ